MPPISILVKPASGLCNLRCNYCFYADEMENRSQPSYGIMSDEVLEAVIQKTLAFAQDSCSITFQGGEPTLTGLDFYRKCLKLEEKYNVNQIPVSHSLQTNGYLLDEEWCQFFAEHQFLVGLSLDGIKSAHDAYRKDSSGKDTYFHTLHAAQLLQQAGAEFNILTVVNKRTATKIDKIYHFYQKQGFYWQQYIACLDPIGENAGKQDYSLTPDAYGQFLIDLFRLWSLDLFKGKQPYIRQFENYIGILLGNYPESCEQRGVCTFQNVVEADGSVYPCDFYVLDEYKLGNLREDNFVQIEERRKQSPFIQQSLNHTQKCQSCRYFFICRGGCRRHRQLPGTENGENYFCRSYQMFFDACLPGLQEIALLCSRS